MARTRNAPAPPRMHRRGEAAALAAMALLLLALGAVWGLVLSPEDYRQGAAVRILYVHVPSAWMSLFLWLLLAVCGGALLLSGRRGAGAGEEVRGKDARLAAAFDALAAAGFWFTALTLATGSIWGRAIWACGGRGTPASSLS